MGMFSNHQYQSHRAAAVTTTTTTTTQLPDTPPELVSPSSSTYSSLPSEGPSAWRSRSNGPLSPPMSSYDQPHPSIKTEDMSRKVEDDAQARREPARQQASTASDTPRQQQLPSLSSLFPPGMRSLPSPRSERPPSYPATSPLDPPRSAGGYLERPSGSSSYFPPSGSSVSTHAQSRSVYEPKVFDRTGPSLAPHRAAFPGPLSPGAPRDSARSQHADPNHRWSFHQDMARGSEYSYESRDPRYQTQHLAGQKRSHDSYLSTASSSGGGGAYRGDPRAAPQHHYSPQSHGSSYSHQPATMEGIGGETIPTKDGLGPKIWTGTHFLPRFVRAAELPGEGLCYFYDDGSHCKTVIDGEVVNAHWGVTKAGKPRKRLAIACVTCREKKIKCDPDYPRCVQCEKFGRVCKFKNAPRGGGHHNTSPTTALDEREDSPPRQRAPLEYSRDRQSPSISPRTTEPPLRLAAPPKRMRFDAGYSPDRPAERRPDERREYGPSSTWHQQPGSTSQLPLPRIHDDAFRQRYAYPDRRPDTRV